MSPSPGMLTRRAGHEADARKSEAEDVAEAEAEATHVREQLRVYEHEDWDIVLTF